MSVLVDTSVWVEFLRGTGSHHHLWLREHLRGGGSFIWSEPVLLELANGRGSDLLDAERLLIAGELMAVQHDDWTQAAALLSETRQRGRPVHSTNDALLAAVAIRNSVPVAARDGDFTTLATVSALRLMDIPAG